MVFIIINFFGYSVCIYGNGNVYVDILGLKSGINIVFVMDSYSIKEVIIKWVCYLVSFIIYF